MHPFERREFLVAMAATGLGLTSGGLPMPQLNAAESADPLFRISLAEWSLHKTLQRGELDNLDFPGVARNRFGLDAVEYVNQFFKDKAKDQKYLAELKKRCDDQGVTSLLIMCDGEGALGDPDEARRQQAVENHHKWVEAAKFLGCHSIRVNAQSSGNYEEQRDLAADGLSRLCEFAAPHAINVIVENHGGLSSNADWLAAVIEQVDKPNCGTLPDFGNFTINRQTGEEYDRYQGVEKLMPYAKGVSAKSYQFDDEGNETKIDFVKMVKIVLDAGYHGYIGIEWEGSRPESEYEGIQLTLDLLKKIRDQLAG